MALIAEQFTPGADMMRRVSRMQGYRYVVTENGVGTVEDGELKRMARDLAPQVLDCLLNRARENAPASEGARR